MRGSSCLVQGRAPSFVPQIGHGQKDALSRVFILEGNRDALLTGIERGQSVVEPLVDEIDDLAGILFGLHVEGAGLVQPFFRGAIAPRHAEGEADKVVFRVRMNQAPDRLLLIAVAVDRVVFLIGTCPPRA